MFVRLFPGRRGLHMPGHEQKLACDSWLFTMLTCALRKLCVLHQFTVSVNPRGLGTTCVTQLNSLNTTRNYS
jgi:hypothetical protein